MPPADPVEVCLCVVGEAGVGKTSLIHRFVHDAFDERYVVTLGAKVNGRTLDLRFGGRVQTVRFSLWDIMGNEAFREVLQEAIFPRVHGLLAVCDVTRPETLAPLGGWIAAVEALAGAIPVVVLGNKSDLEGEARIGEAELAAFCRPRAWRFALASARTGRNVALAFRWLAEAHLRRGRGAGSGPLPRARAQA